MDDHKAIGIIKLSFTLFGTFILIFGIYSIYNNYLFLKTAKKTEAVITKIERYTRPSSSDESSDTYYNISIKYNVDGTSYDGVTTEYKQGMVVGDRVSIYYSPFKPSDFRNISARYIGYVPTVFGIVFLGIARMITRTRDSY